MCLAVLYDALVHLPAFHALKAWRLAVMAIYIYDTRSKIKVVNIQKLLGIYIDKNPHWTDHIDYLCSDITSKISLLR